MRQLFLCIWLLMETMQYQRRRKNSEITILSIAHSFLHTDTHLLTSYTSKVEKTLSIIFFLIKCFKADIFNLFCTNNTNGNSLLFLILLLLTVMLSQPYQIEKKDKLNYGRNEHIKDQNARHHLFHYDPSPMALFSPFSVTPSLSPSVTYFRTVP